MKLYLTRAVALGNGTRPKGFCIGDCKLDPLRDELVPESFKASEGVLPVEIVNAARNPTLLTATPPGVTAPPSAPTASGRSRKPSGGAASLKDKGDGSPADAWKAKPIEELGLAEDHLAIIRKAGLSTAGDLAEFGDKNSGFMGMEGVTIEIETAILDAIEAVADA